MVLRNTLIEDNEINRLRERIGKELRVYQHNTAAAQDSVTWMAYAVGDDNPLWLDAGYAAQTRYGCTLAPPYFLYSVLIPSGALAGGLPGVHSFFGGNEWRFFKPIRVNTPVSASAKLVDVTEKQGAYAGRTVVLTVEATYKDGRGVVLATARGWSLRTEREAARQRGKYAKFPPPAYTPEQSKLIEEICSSRKPRGATLLYWDEVAEGDELPILAKGPLAREDMEAYIAATGSVKSTYYRVKDFRKHPAFYFSDPYTNNWEPVSMVNLYAYAAEAVGIPRPYDMGSQRICWLAHMLTGWMGDDGFLEKLDVKVVRPNLFGETQFCKGKVAGKSVEGERNLVDIDVWCENQHGEKTTVGRASVSLFSKRVVRYWSPDPSPGDV